MKARSKELVVTHLGTSSPAMLFVPLTSLELKATVILKHNRESTASLPLIEYQKHFRGKHGLTKRD